jgi:hypothetical protein
VPLSLLYGLLIGFAQLLATLTVYFLGLHGSAEGLAKAQKPESLIGFVLLMVLLGLAHRAAKKASLARGEPELTFGAAAKLASLTALVAALVAAVTQWIYAAWINPRLPEIQRAEVMERAAPELAKLPAADAALITERIESATSAATRGAIFGLNTFLFALLLGLAYALIFRAAVRRDAAASKKPA